MQDLNLYQSIFTLFYCYFYLSEKSVHLYYSLIHTWTVEGEQFPEIKTHLCCCTYSSIVISDEVALIFRSLTLTSLSLCNLIVDGSKKETTQKSSWSL